MDQVQKPVKRLCHYVDPEVQRPMLLQCAKHSFLFLLTAFVLTFMIQVNSGPGDVDLLWHLQDFWNQYGLICVILFCLLPLYLLDMVRTTNRFAGPVSRLRRALRSVSSGEEVRPLTFRRSDFWQEMSNEFNAAMATVNRDRQNMTTGVRQNHGAGYDQTETRGAAGIRPTETSVTQTQTVSAERNAVCVM